MSDPGVTGNINEINSLEHDSDGVNTKKVLLYGWDGLNKVRLKTAADGTVATSIAASITLNPGDIEIGAVEIKDSSSDQRMVVNADGSINSRIAGCSVTIPVLVTNSSSSCVTIISCPVTLNVNVTNQTITVSTTSVTSVSATITSMPTVTVQSIASAPTVYNITMTTANLEYTLTLPAICTSFEIKLRSMTDTLKLSFAPGGSGTSYVTIPSNNAYVSDGTILNNKVIYFQSPTASMTAEVIAYA